MKNDYTFMYAYEHYAKSIHHVSTLKSIRSHMTNTNINNYDLALLFIIYNYY